MKINILIPSITSLNTNNDGNNVQGDELVARLWAKNLSDDTRVTFVDLNGKRKDYDLSISFTPLVESTSGYKVLYMQNVFPKPYWQGTVETFQQVKNRYNQYIFPSDGLKNACNENSSLVLQFATDFNLFNKKEYNLKLDYNICFVGNKIRDDKTNERYLYCLKDKGLAIFGNPSGWNLPYCKGKISLNDEAVLYSSSKICVNAHLDEHLQYGSYNFRIFNALACGGFVISDRSEHLEKEFKDCIVFTDGYEDLKNKVDYYLDNQQETVKFRENGFSLVKEKHTFKHRMNSLLDWLENKI
jgi:spore maturation protein CgeB